MELYYTPNSPYSRVARVLALEKGIDVTFVPVTVRESADHLLEYNPAAKVPSLKLTNGRVLSGTRIICEYFENLSTGGFLAAVTDIDGRCREGLVSGLLDGVAVWVRETISPPLIIMSFGSGQILLAKTLRVWCETILIYLKYRLIWPFSRAVKSTS